MIRRRELINIFIIGCFYVLCHEIVIGAPEKEQLYSGSTAELFVQQADRIYRQDPLDSQKIEQAMTFLNAALALNPSSSVVAEQILKVGSANSMASRDYSEIITWALDQQVREQDDLQILTDAVRYLLEQKNSRLDREVLLEKLLRQYAGLNKAFSSELATQLGLLAVEKADMQSALDWLAYAQELNPHNQLAFQKLQELSSSQNLVVKPEVYLVQLRMAIDLNPYDLNQVLLYADTLNRMQLYELSAPAYEYATKLYAFLYPEKPLDDSILLSWVLSCYHAPRQETKCFRIIDQYHEAERFDLMLQAVAGKAAMKLGQVEKAKTILETAGKKAEKLLSENDMGNPIYPEQLAWYYSFVFEQPEKALAWANQAYKQAPQREGVEPIFAYTLTQSGQMELAKEYAEPHHSTSQVASLVMAMAALSEDERAEALDLLRSTIDMMPESFVAEKAQRILNAQGSEYVISVSVASAQAALTKAYENQIVPEFAPPQKRFSSSLFFGGSEFFYGIEFDPKLSIKNTSNAPLTIGPGSYLQGYLRVDAVVTGDLNVEFPDLLRMRFRPSRPVLPGEHVSVSLPLDTGKLRILLLTYPQADVDIKFTVYLDPLEKDSGEVENALIDTDPVTERIHRSGVVLTRDFLIQRLDALDKGQQGQKIRAIRLFSGLLAEQRAFQANEVLFKYIQIDRTLLTDAVRRALRDEDWKVRIQALNSLLSLEMPLSPVLVPDISTNLSHDKWPIRMMTMLLLAADQGDTFRQVLDWAVRQDESPLNRRMAAALGGSEENASVPSEP